MVITDLNMPIMNGIEFIEAARADPAGRALPMLLLTTETAEELKARARRAKATGWLTKPFDPDVILSLVKQLA
jgi:two-component system chemotaxis response regulator CheY